MPVPRVTAAPLPEELVLSGWAFVRSDRNEVHVAGYDEMGHVGHVSPRIAAYDRGLKTAMVETRSMYMLVGGPGLGLDAQRALTRWLAARALTSWDDVTDLVVVHGLGAAIQGEGCCEA